MIDLHRLALLKGKSACKGIANDQSIAWVRQAFHGFGADVAVTSSSTSRSLCGPWRSSWGVDFMPLDLQREGQFVGCIREIEKSWGKLIGGCIRWPCTEGGFAGSRRRLLEEGFPPRRWTFVWSFIRMGKAGRADEGRRHLVHNDLLRLADGRGALQHDGT